MFQFIVYLNDMKFYLLKHIKQIDFQMMNKFKNFVIVELRIKMTKKIHQKQRYLFEITTKYHKNRIQYKSKIEISN